MEIVKPSAILCDNEYGNRAEMFARIKHFARICYGHIPDTNFDPKSDKSDCEKWVMNRIKNEGHISIARLIPVYMKIEDPENIPILVGLFADSPYCICDDIGGYIFISTNYQFILDNDLEEEFNKFQIFNDIPDSVKQYTFLVRCSRAISAELNRVSPNRILERSTRYCNFSKDKYGKSINFIEPHYYEQGGERIQECFKADCVSSEFNYFNRLEQGFIAQDARGALSLDVETYCLYTYDVKMWTAIINKRFYGTTGKPHPDAKIIASHIRDNFPINGSIYESDDRWDYVSNI